MTKNNIDRNRIFVSGFSGGSRTANELCFYQNDIYKGAVLCCGVDFNFKVSKVNATLDTDINGNPYGNMLVVSDEDFNYASNNLKFARITGANDFRRGNILDIYNGGFNPYNFNAKLFDVSKMSHENCSGEILGKALSFLTESNSSKASCSNLWPSKHLYYNNSYPKKIINI